MSDKTRLLLIEDDPSHILLCRHSLINDPYEFQVDVASTGTEALAKLAKSQREGKTYDAIALDNRLPDYYGFDLLALLKRQAPYVPIIMVTGYRDDELALEALRRGAIDYLPKTADYHKHLPRIIQLNIERNTLYASIQQLHQLEERYRILIETAQDAIITVDHEGNIELFNHIAESTFGYQSDEVRGRAFLMLFPDQVRKQQFRMRTGDLSHQLSGYLSGYTGRTIEILGRRKDGSEVPLELSLSSCELNNKQVLTAIARDIAERKRLQEALRTLNNKLVTAQEEERKNISRELHDEIGQSLATINIGLQLIRDELPANNQHIIDDLEASMGDIKHVIRSLRELSVSLHPHILDDLGLVAAVRWLAKEIANRTNIHINLQVPAKTERYLAEIELLMFRICQESLTNVVKHARASTVEIIIKKSRASLHLQVQDDGCGFDVTEASLRDTKGLGLVGMKERVTSLGGEFHITSGTQKGTKISVKIPVRQS